MEIVLSILGMLFGMIIAWKQQEKIYKKKLKEISRMSDKHLEMFLMMDKWIQNEMEGKKISTYLRNNGFYNLTIYGMGYIGRTLYEYLKSEGFEINNLIDQSSFKRIDGMTIKKIDDEHVSTDAVIVTAIYYFEELEDKLKTKFKEPVLSLADIIYKVKYIDVGIEEKLRV